MQEYRLPFATFYNHENGIAEVIVDENVEVTARHQLEGFALFESMSPPVSWLISNRKNSYSFSFGAMMQFGKNRVIKAVAVVTYGKRSLFQLEKIWPKSTGLAFFKTREEAIAWIGRLQAEAKESCQNLKN